MSNLEDEMMELLGKQYTESLARSMRGTINKIIVDELEKYRAPDYYSKRKYGKWTIYNGDGARIAWGLNENEVKNYMKLLKKED